MFITTVDEERIGPVQAEVSDHRIEELRHFFGRHPEIFGFGAGRFYGRNGARDAVEANNFAVSQLAYVEQKVYEKQYAKMRFEEVLGPCISYSASPGATTVEYEVMDYVGMGKRISPSADDIPYADVASARIPMTIANGGIGYRVTTEDLRNAAFNGRPLPMRRMEAAMLAYRRHMNFVALQGEAGSNFTGLFNNASVTAANAPTGAWATATADQMVADLNFGMAAVRAATKDNDYPTVIAMPIFAIERLNIPRSTNSDTTVQEFFLRTHPGLRIISCDELLGIGGGGTNNRIVFFNPTDDNMVLHLPMTQQFLAPQYVDLAIKVPSEYKYGGLNIRRLPSVYYMNNI
jgi:hypothetical protein